MTLHVLCRHVGPTHEHLSVRHDDACLLSEPGELCMGLPQLLLTKSVLVSGYVAVDVTDQVAVPEIDSGCQEHESDDLNVNTPGHRGCGVVLVGELAFSN